MIGSLLFLHLLGVTSAQQTQESWDTYTSAYEDGIPGSVTLRMDLIDEVPLKDLTALVITGLTYSTDREDGFPDAETLQELYQIEDELVQIIDQEYQGLIVGSFMHNHQRLEYFYLNNPAGLKERLKEFYKTNYPDRQYYIALKEDAEWQYYREFLYPNREIQNYMADQAVIRRLMEAGDNLLYARRVDHWIYLPDNKELKALRMEVESMHFQVESKDKITGSLPYELHISRVDKVDFESIHQVTSVLRKLAIEHRGRYDGWETNVIK